MRRRFPLACCGLCLLSGCSLFTSQAQISKLSHRVSTLDLKSIRPGDWCRVKLAATNYGLVRRQTEYVGQLRQVSTDSITLSDVTAQSLIEYPPLENLPFLRRPSLPEKQIETEELPIHLALDRIEAIEWIASADVENSRWGRIDSRSGRPGSRLDPEPALYHQSPEFNPQVGQAARSALFPLKVE